MDLSTSGRRRVRRPVLPANYRNCSLHAEIEPDVFESDEEFLSPPSSLIPYQILTSFLPHGKRNRMYKENVTKNYTNRSISIIDRTRETIENSLNKIRASPIFSTFRKLHVSSSFQTNPEYCNKKIL